MKKIASALVVGLLVAAIAPATALAGSGGGPTAGSGAWDDCNIVRTIDQAGPNTILTVTILKNYFGMLEGRYEGVERIVVHPNGNVSFHGSGTFSGTVAGLTGTGRLSYVGKLDGSIGTIPTTGPGSAKWVLTGRTGELASVIARGTFGGGALDSWNAWYPVECDGGFYGGDYSGQVITQ